MTKKRRPTPSPTEQLANLYGSLAEDIRAGHIEIDEEEAQEAYRVGRRAIEKALASKKGVATEEEPQGEWVEKKGGDKNRPKGHQK